MGTSCKSCCAPVSYDLPDCEYCGTFNEIEMKNSFGKISIEIVTNDSSRFCPHCSLNMETIEIECNGKHQIERCPECFGLFFDKGELDLFLENVVVFRTEPDYLKVSKGLYSKTKVSNIKYVPCPICDEVMTRKSYSLKSGVIVDRCREHGIWLDNGELQKLIEFKSAGGDEMARKRERENEKSEDRIRKYANRPILNDDPFYLDDDDWF